MMLATVFCVLFVVFSVTLEICRPGLQKAAQVDNN